MIFWCLPNNRCEWCNLRGFVQKYNTIHGKSYRPSRFLDEEIRDSSQPEVLLEAHGETPIVIERKSIVWPSGQEHFADHHKGHQLLDDFVKQIELCGNPFADGLYQLSVNETDLKGKRMAEIARFAEQIADSVLSWQFRIKSEYGFASDDPIAWSFRALGPEDIDDGVPESGIGISINWHQDPFELRQMNESIEQQKAGYSQEFQLRAEQAAEKFAQYGRCKKLFLVQFFSPDHSFLSDEHITEIVEEAHLPEVIDEVWVADQDWISLDDYVIAWVRIR